MLVDLIGRTIAGFGEIGVAILMFIENLIPIIPSEVIMPLCGYAAAEGEMSLIGVMIAGTLGGMLGQLPWYFVGHAFGQARVEQLADRYGRFLTVSGEEVRAATRWFERHGEKAVFFGRMIPAVRGVISIPAGVSRMPLGRFLAYSTVGSFLWVAFLTFAGFKLREHWNAVKHWVDPVLYAIVGGALLLYVYRLVAGSRHRTG